MAGKKASTGKTATRGRKIKDTNIVVEESRKDIVAEETKQEVAVEEVKENIPAKRGRKPSKASAATTEQVIAETVTSKKRGRKPAADKVEDSSTKKSSKKTAENGKSALVTFETYLEIDGFQYGIHGLEDRIKEAYKAEGHRVSSIKSLQVYINPYERRAYYVINGKSENKYVEL